jgi:hypothetical protein
MILFVPQLFMAVGFRMIFVVVNDASLAGHTIGFFGLQILLMTIAYINYFYNTSKGQLIVPKWLAVTYLVCVTVLTITKIAMTSATLAGRSFLDTSNSNHTRAAQGMDILWMIFNAVIPGVIAFRMRKSMDKITITVG